MSLRSHDATGAELERLWPAARGSRLFDSPAEMREFAAEAPWRVRVDGRSDAAIVERWRSHLDILSIRALWTPNRRLSRWVDDLAAVARQHGFGRLLSPLLPQTLLRQWLAQGMRLAEPLVAFQGAPSVVAAAASRTEAVVRHGRDEDLRHAEEIDRESFGEFWRYGPRDLGRAVRRERFAVAVVGGQVVGYTLCTVSRGSGVLSRLAVHPSARRTGIGSALLAEAAASAERSGAVTFTLCTQESNSASRSLYAGAGLTEVAERYGLAIGSALRE
ncbi:MAG: GNAT family N-acetyltransferase [Coriobacteriales bacterium]|nr:GNAT family N-acetyltransferase [Coriobacteriales bacterium]